MKIFKKNTKYIILTLLSLFLIISCNDTTSSNGCTDKCQVEGEYSCDGKNLQICKKLPNGCFGFEKIKECENSCKKDSCEDDTCEPTCNEWESCIDTTCKLQDGKCNTKADCKDDKVCDDTHTCVDVSNDCEPTCNEWENCINKVCTLQDGKCNTKADCEDNQICDNNSCIDEVKKRKTKISLGANKKMNSASFKVKINLGKIRTSKNMKSTNFKMKLGNGIK